MWRIKERIVDNLEIVMNNLVYIFTKFEINNTIGL